VSSAAGRVRLRPCTHRGRVDWRVDPESTRIALNCRPALRGSGHDTSQTATIRGVREVDGSARPAAVAACDGRRHAGSARASHHERRPHGLALLVTLPTPTLRHTRFTARKPTPRPAGTDAARLTAGPSTPSLTATCSMPPRSSTTSRKGVSACSKTLSRSSATTKPAPSMTPRHPPLLHPLPAEAWSVSGAVAGIHPGAGGVVVPRRAASERPRSRLARGGIVARANTGWASAHRSVRRRTRGQLVVW
jgi:hypothetical protein